MTERDGESIELEAKLEPCPFCGKDATRIRPNVHTGLLQIQCDDCWATSVTSTNRAVVIAAWNRRAGKDGEAASTMLAALIEIANDPDTPADLRGMAFAVIAQAQAAGITTGEDE
jgi:Lar family restriction alleviation protein